MIRTVLFDLDGTVADTAPDLGYALNRMRHVRGLGPLPLTDLRPVASLGARGLLNVGFGMDPAHPEYAAMRQEFLQLYERNICLNTRLFAGIEELLASLESRGIRWGIVTNKAERLARCLLEEMRLATRACCIVGGDTTPHAKPHPEPLLAACRAMDAVAGACLYVGDDRRDIEAGRAAGMKTAAARWGYLNGGNPESWQADWVIAQPADVLPLLDP